jgi:hypothetical protein
MKKIILLVICIVIFSCKKNNENVSKVSENEIIKNLNSIILNKTV